MIQSPLVVINFCRIIYYAHKIDSSILTEFFHTQTLECLNVRPRELNSAVKNNA